ncbi:MAG: MMPL family transporter, partial [Actinomycetota bacterium]
SEEDLQNAEKYSMPIVFIVLTFVFGSLVAVALPLVLGIASVSVALALLFFLGQRLSLSVFILNMVTMVGLGLGIDYSLFMVNRFREEAASRETVSEAVAATMATAGKAVTFSGVAVMVGLAMMIPFTIVFLRSMGIGGMLVAALSVLVAVTLLPALLSILGRRVNSLRVIPRKYLLAGGGRFWRYFSRLVMRRPVAFLAVSAAAMVLLAWQVTGMTAGVPGVDDLSAASDSRKGIELFNEKWGQGEASPLNVVLETDSPYAVWETGFREGVKELKQRLEADNRVARVDAVSDLEVPAGFTSVLKDPLLLEGFARENPRTANMAAATVNLKGGSTTTVLKVVPAITPRSPAVMELVRELRADILPGIERLSGARAMVGGGPAEAVDFTDSLKQSFPWLVAVVLLITYGVLLLLFRSVVLPLKAIFMNLLSVAAAYGALVVIFQHGWGAGILGFTKPEGIIPFVPVILFSTLFGLSMDYEVFLLSRMREEYEAERDNERAVTLGLEKTGRIITTAALIMIAVFGSFSFAESIVIKEIGVGLAVSILLDATIVRVIIVPATMKLLGDWNWWLPGWLDRLLPHLGGHKI